MFRQDSSEPEIERRLFLKRLLEMGNLPSPSPSVMSVMAILRDEDVEMGRLVKAIEMDQALVAQLLKMVNSSFYGLRNSIDSVARAVAMLGLDGTKRLVYSAAIMKFFTPEDQIEWDHSYSSSLLMAALLKENGIGGASELPLAAILHDIGKVVLRGVLPQKHKLAARMAAEHGEQLFETERRMLRIDHAEAGALLLKKWNCSERMASLVQQHHMPGPNCEFALDTALLQFVNWIDCSARKLPCRPPSKELMDAAEIDSIDSEYWLDYQTRLITRLRGEGAAIRDAASSSGKLRTKLGTHSLMKRNHRSQRRDPSSSKSSVDIKA